MLEMDEDQQWEVVREFLVLVASYLVIKVAQSNAVNEIPTAFKGFEASLNRFQDTVKEDRDEDDPEYETNNPNDND